MIDKKFQNLELSALGFGTMRFPMIGEGDEQRIDVEKTMELLRRAHSAGINYFDTAFMYHDGLSEGITGDFLRTVPRESYYLADKYPAHVVPTDSDVHKIFQLQLERCGVDYFDFYLLHNVNDRSIDIYMDESLRIVDKILQEKEKGRIKHLGFSTHASVPNLQRFLDRYGFLMEFGQIQLNFLDWTLQDAKTKYEMLTKQGIPVWVMEPTRGGALTAFSAEDEERMKAHRPEESIASWAFRWLETLPNVQMVLSGMTTMEALEDNLRTFSAPKPLTPHEVALVEEISGSLVERVPCTACRYCTAGCPVNLDIPALLHLYNDFRFKPGSFTRFSTLRLTDTDGPAACVACSACTKACPQGIEVPEVMEEFARLIEQERG